MTANTLLRVKGITVQFGGLKAVDDVSFDVQQGELLGLIGPNGAGKTTLMRAITGVVTANSGSIHLGDQALTGLPTHQRIRRGLAFSQQLVRPFREISVLDNVALAAGSAHTRSPLKALLHTDSTRERDIARSMLERVGIAQHADQMPGIQPLGVLKRLEVARALAQEPKLLLLDEPLAGLNSREATTLADTIAQINRQGVTIILIEHNLGEVMRICQRLVVLDNGRNIANGPPREVMQQPQVRAAYLGAEKSADITEEQGA
ncbi:MAG TPA: ABC transporter ATP-binding protein [Pusillimonas sp.]|uniref:ABC transporter ATP-binding protein n=1 Tax=unclassified Pusillimonas TaxID=2640016 RepID=UPI002614CE32|nr:MULTISPECIES: ABC transporter ATP-binding protein [unclassified Pusillimonas]HLU20342.1 ABC transporter ATP-binding protein [Pusillimonas sp.]